MKPLVLDTNILIDFCQNPSAHRRTDISSFEQMLIPSIVLGEFMAGVFATRKGNEALSSLQQLIACPSVKVVPITERTSEMYAKVYQALRAQGRPIPQNDMWIAASALEHGADIATHDEHFKLVPMLTVIIPNVSL